MAHEFRCDRCKKLETVQGGRQTYEMKQEGTMVVRLDDPEEFDILKDPKELCGACVASLRVWLRKIDE